MSFVKRSACRFTLVLPVEGVAVVEVPVAVLAEAHLHGLQRLLEPPGHLLLEGIHGQRRRPDRAAELVTENHKRLQSQVVRNILRNNNDTNVTVSRALPSNPSMPLGRARGAGASRVCHTCCDRRATQSGGIHIAQHRETTN